MSEFGIDRRSLLRGLAAAAGGAGLAGEGSAAPSPPDTDPHAQLVYAAVVDAVVPRTPGLADELCEAHVPGGLEAGLDAYLATYVNDLFSGLTRLGDRTGDLRLAEVVALVLEEAALELVATGGNEDAPELRFARDLRDRSTTVGEVVDVAAAGLFPRLSRRDRLNALTLLDEKEVDTAVLADATPLPLLESDGGLVPTLVVGFTEVVYYSEWQGYDDFAAPPSSRSFENDPDAVQSWRQSGFPGVADGYAAFRGYWGDPESALGEGGVYGASAGGGEPGEPERLWRESGAFRENDYDTSGYEEPFPTGGDADTDGAVSVGGTEGSTVESAEDALGDGDGTLDVGEDEGGVAGSVGEVVDGTVDDGVGEALNESGSLLDGGGSPW